MLQSRCHPTAAVEVRHPLDPLTAEEIARAVSTLRAGRDLGALPRFPFVELKEPPKAEVDAFVDGVAFSRVAFLLTLDIATGRAGEALVDLRSDSLVSWRELETDHERGHPPIIVEDFFRAADIVKADPQWRASMVRRGLTESEIDLVQIDPISPGYFDFEPYKGRRILRAVSYYREFEKDNAYAHPIEGVVAVVDLIAGRVIHSSTTAGCADPRQKRNYDRENLSPARTDLKPLEIVQPEGPSFTVDGWKVSWQNWSSASASRRAKAWCCTSSAISDGGRLRSIIYRASITEMVVPYADPTAEAFLANAPSTPASTAWASCANALELGCDCLGQIHYFDVPAADDSGNAFVMKNAICMHEEDYGILWKHNEFRRNGSEVRRSRRLVGLLLRHRRQLRLRLLLVSLPGRHHPVRSQAHRHRPDRRGDARREIWLGRDGHAAARRPLAPAFFQRASAHGDRRRRQQRHGARVRRVPVGAG